MALRRGEVRWAVVPIENSLEGSINVTLDLLAGEASDVEIVGEALLRVAPLADRGRAGAARGDRDGDHPPAGARAVHALPARRAGACARPAGELDRGGGAHGGRGGAARARRRSGPRWRREIYGGTVLRERDRGPRRTTKRASCGSRGHGTSGGPERPPLRAARRGAWKTSLVFWGAGAERPGWLVRCLDEFARRDINLHEDRVAAAARAARQLHVLRRPRRSRRASGPSRRRSRACARCASRCACSAPTARRRRRARETERTSRGPVPRDVGAPLHCGPEYGEHSPTRAGGVRVALRAPAARTWHIARDGDGWSGARPERHV